MSRTVPLMLQLSAADPRPLGKQITDGIRLQIASGELPVGSQLPSVRGLAQQLTINPNTVAKAYTELTNEGWLDARQGLGLFVAEPRQLLSDSERERRLSLAVDSFTAEVVGLGYPLETVLARLESTLAPCLKRRA
ncbi:GntR family transcriptional regulator [Permianibacter aggregans]|uniref:GntR family transcriptional regulator n=1 Tax=Permianibacter aggregans TaxID=1510150 RepID=A0A4R6UAD5_9GAMM|nr:GntR family transcriptional regulator [Permianibacter aggregans]TDQ41839.1 GntR family transcriptional regulator [Permianibacter aggregans]